MKAKRSFAATMLGFIFLVITANSTAFANDKELLKLIQGLQQRIEVQEQRIQKLEMQGPGIQNAELVKDVELLKRQREVDQEVNLKKEKETPIVVASKDGFGLKSKNSDFEIKLKGQIQTQGRYFADREAPNTADTFLIRKARPILEGKVFKYFDFKLMADFANLNNIQVVDAYVDYKYWKGASFKVGKFKSPIGLERLQPDAWNLFPELGLTSNLVPNRDVGVDLHGELFDGVVNYDLGWFNGSFDNANGLADTDVDHYKDGVARLFFLPFKNTMKDWLNGLGVGVAGSVGSAHGTTSAPNLPTFKTGGQQTFFAYSTASTPTAANTTIADGLRTRIVPQFYYYYGPFGVLGEFVMSNQNVKKGTTASAVKNTAGQIAASYVLTGENASYTGVVVRNEFDPGKGKWGAFEIAGRFNWLDAGKENLARFANLTNSDQKATAWALGLNWYLNKNLKWSTSFEQTFFGGIGSSITTWHRRPENALITMLQLVF